MNSSSRDALRVAWCDHKAAAFAVRHWHYTKSLPTPPVIKLGVWEHGKFVGVVLFSRGASDNLGSPYGLAPDAVCELTRVALGPHQTPVSRVLRMAIKLLRAQCPGLRLIVSYADANQGHHGGIYQATNWLFVGRTASDYQYIDSTGRAWHSRQVSATGVKTQYGKRCAVVKTSDCKRVKMAGKYKYLFALDAAMTDQIAPLKKPYPKREVVHAAIG